MVFSELYCEQAPSLRTAVLSATDKIAHCFWLNIDFSLSFR